MVASKQFSKKATKTVTDVLSNIFDIIGDKLEDINPYFKDKPTTTQFNDELLDDMEKLGFDPTEPENLTQYDILRRKKISGEAPRKEFNQTDIPSDDELQRIIELEDGGPDTLNQIEAFNERYPIRDSDFEDVITEEKIGGVNVSELDSYYSTDVFPEADINKAYTDPNFPVDIDKVMRKYDIFGGTTNLNTKTNVGFDLPRIDAEKESGAFGIGKRLLSYYSPVENTISALRFPDKGLTMKKVRELLQDSIPELSKKMEYDLGGLRLKLNELQALDGNKLYSKKEIMNLYQDHGIYVEARILKGKEATFFEDQRLPIKKLRLSSGREIDPKIADSYFEIDISATTQAGNRKMLNILQQTESEGIKPLSDNFRYAPMNANPMLRQGHFKPTNLAHARGSIMIGTKGKKQILVEEIQQDPQNIIGRNRAAKREGDLDELTGVLTAKIPSVEFVSQLIQALIVHARKEGIDEIVFPSAFRVAQLRTTANLEFKDIPPKFIDVYEKGLTKYLKDLIDESGGKVKMRQEILSFDASPSRSSRDLSTIINIKDFKFDAKRSKAKFSKGGLVQKRGLMPKAATA